MKFYTSKYPIHAGGNRPQMRLDLSSSSLSNLPSDFQVGSVSYSPSTRHVGSDAGASWPGEVGPTLAEEGAGTPTYNWICPTTDDQDESVYYSGSAQHYSDTVITTTSSCLITEMVVRVGTELDGASCFLWGIGKPGDAAPRRLDIRRNATSLSFRANGTNSAIVNDTFGGWVHLAVAYLHNSALYMVINGGAVSAETTSVASVDWDNVSQRISIGGLAYTSSDLFDAHDDSVAFCSTWVDDSMSFTLSEFEAAAQMRFALLCGTYPQQSTGTPTPTADRASTKKLQVGGYLHDVWDGWISPSDNPDENFTGIQIERTATNTFQYSEDFANAYWTPTNCTIGSDVATAPDNYDTADSIIGDTSTGEHYVVSSKSGTVSVHVFSCYVKAGDKDKVKLNTTGAPTSGECYFDLAAGTAVNPGVDVVSYGISAALANGWRRCWVAYSGLAASHSHSIQPVTATDGTGDSYTGDGSTVDLYVWGAQHESDFGAPSSYIKTTSASVTRPFDSLGYEADNIEQGRGRVKWDYWWHDADCEQQHGVWSISDGTSNNGVFAVLRNTDAFGLYTFNAVGANDNCLISGDFSDGDEHSCTAYYADQDIRLNVDADADTSNLADIPSGLTTISFGGVLGGAYAFCGWIRNWKWFKR